MQIKFIKMHGAGNDFIMIDNMSLSVRLSAEQVRYLCDRHRGIGADGVILVEPATGADCFMNYINADGTEAQMCGNGVRCVAHFLKNYIPKFKDASSVSVDTRSGIKPISAGEADTYSVDMGEAEFASDSYPSGPVELVGMKLDFVSVGNPFAVAIVDSVDDFDLALIGPKVEHNAIFPHRINFEIIEKVAEGKYKARVWERGCGETLACGSGACGIYALLSHRGAESGPLEIDFPGGRLELSRADNGSIVMKGPARTVFTGDVNI